MESFHAKAGGGQVVDVNTGEVVALDSLPDFDPNNPADVLDPLQINRLTVGVYEMGSTFKALSLAMALESGKVDAAARMSSARQPCVTGGSPFTISTPRIAC